MDTQLRSVKHTKIKQLSKDRISQSSGKFSVGISSPFNRSRINTSSKALSAFSLGNTLPYG